MSGVASVMAGVSTDGTVTGSLAVLQLNVPKSARPLTVRTTAALPELENEMFDVPCPFVIVPFVIDQSYELQPPLAEAVPLVEHAGVPSVMTGFAPASWAWAVLVDAQPFESVKVSVMSTVPLPSAVKAM